MGWVWPTHVNMHFLCSLAWQEFGQRMLRYFLLPLLYGMGLVTTCCDGLSARVGMVVFGQQMLRFILCYRWHMRVGYGQLKLKYIFCPR
jgi:hypothetical protein